MAMRRMYGWSIFLAGVLAGAALFVAVLPVTQAQTLSPEERARLQAEYDILQKEIAEWQQVLEETRNKKASLQGDVTVLNAQIKKAEAEIKQRNNIISRLGTEIQEKTKHIATLEERLENGRDSLAELLREKDRIETTPLAILALSSQNLSEFFATVDEIDIINRDLQDHFEELRAVRSETEKEKEVLSIRKNQETDARYEVEVKKKQIKEDEQEKQELLTITKNEEKSYQEVLSERQQRAEAIRSALFDLRDAQGISFETALQYANQASAKTGVRAALILAILSQESDLGKNIGSCYVTDLQSGDGVGKNTGTAFEKVMKAPRDTVPFQQVTSGLSISWSTTPVSCPLGKVYSPSRGYGGAMGPSQFIPSTWEMFVPRLKTALGVSLPNPWNPAHAIMATAIYMEDLGAGGQTYTAERNAACRYYSGRSCDTRSPVNYTYGNSVVAKAEQFQENIDFLQSL